MSNDKKIICISGIDCANCAMKIEDEINKIDGVTGASLDFVSGKVVIESTNDKKDLEKNIAEILTRVEPDAKIVTDENHTHEHFSLKARIVLIIVGVILFAAALILVRTGFIAQKSLPAIMLFLSAYIILGRNVLKQAGLNIVRGSIFDENFLMSIATIGAFIIGEFPEGVAVMLFYQIGETFQDMAVNKSRRSISALMNIRPDSANIKTSTGLMQVKPEDVAVGDTIVVKPGEKIPLDGIVLDGRSSLDTSAITGESVPRDVKKGDTVISGSINHSGLLEIEITKKFEDSTVAKILELVQNASANKAPTEKFITKFARYYTPVVVILALSLAVIPPLIVANATFADWGYRALVFLVVSCPCALVVSVPLGFFGGIGAASANGILIKGSNYLEALNNVGTIVFDKTGTLTKGVFAVTGVDAEAGFSVDDILFYAAHGESFSTHPIAVSIVNACKTVIDQSAVKDYVEVAGKGISFTLNENKISVGSCKYLGIPEKVAGSTSIYVSINNKFAGVIHLADELKNDSIEAISELHKQGIKTCMLTGDNNSVAEKIANKIGIDMFYSELLPHEKVEKFEKISDESAKYTAFVGDGINDAPSLAGADIGIAMGGVGSDVAIEAADIVIMTDEPSKISTAIQIAKRTNRIVWQNIIFALGIKIIILGLGAAGIATMWMAIFGDVGVALIAVLNSMRALIFKVAK